MSSIDKGLSISHNSFSPINISQYVRPAQSVNYQVHKVESGSTKEEVHFQNKFRSSEVPDSQSIDIQPQYVVEHFKVGSKYEGYKLNGQRHGKGKFYYQDGGFYDGEWNNNKMEGYGILFYQSNHKAYEGQWVNDQFHGFGKLFNDKPMNFD